MRFDRTWLVSGPAKKVDGEYLDADAARECAVCIPQDRRNRREANNKVGKILSAASRFHLDGTAWRHSGSERQHRAIASRQSGKNTNRCFRRSHAIDPGVDWRSLSLCTEPKKNVGLDWKEKIIWLPFVLYFSLV